MDHEAIAKCLKENVQKKKSFIIKEGEIGTNFFIIVEGIVSVTKRNEETGKHEKVCSLTAGDYFGDMALLNDSPRNASVICETQVITWALSRSDFKAHCGHIAFAKRTAISAEAEERKKKKEIADNKCTFTPADRKMILRALEENVLFQNLRQELILSVIDRMIEMKVAKGTDIIKQGDLGDYFYVVKKGSFDIYINKNWVANCEEGRSFGELALMYNSPRAATVKASEASEVWAIDRRTYREIVSSSNASRLMEYEHFLTDVENLQVLLASERSKIADALEEASFEANYKIIKEGTSGTTFYIVKKGKVKAEIKQPDGTMKQVALYGPGEYFGERALLTQEPRAATLTTLEPCECLYLEKSSFDRVLGPLTEIFKERIDGYKKVEEKNDKLVMKELRKDIKLKDLKTIGLLGKGSFGVVTLVKAKNTGETFALKQVYKSQVQELGQQSHVMNEKGVMASISHPSLIRLHATFNEKESLYFLLEPSLGGELFSVLRNRNFFSEATAQFYAAGVILAFEYMHSKGIVYRDLKPENLLLDKQGYIKITDFGFAKHIGATRTWTLCGTPDYLAPEIINGKGHGKAVDWWTLGILIYEMLASYPPFYDENPLETYNRIVVGEITFPVHFSRSSISIIKGLLKHRPTDRLGAVNGGASKIIKHSWFKRFNWDKFKARKMTAPIVMPIRSDTDTSNFQEYDDDSPPPKPYVPDADNADWDKSF